MSLEVCAFVVSLLDKIDRLRVEVDRLNKTPKNSSLPPSTQHPHAKPPRSRAKKEEAAGLGVRAPLDISDAAPRVTND